MSKYTTGEIAKLCGVTVRTVQYYDKRGILIPSELTEGGRRLYTEDDRKRLSIICFLRDLDLPIDSIAKLLAEDHPEKVLEILVGDQEQLLIEEITDKQEKLSKLKELKKNIQNAAVFSFDSIADIAEVMKNKENLKKVHRNILIAGIPLNILQWATILLWVIKGIWWPFLIWAAIAPVYSIWVSRYYFSNVKYICPECHEVFKPSLKEAIFARHTPNTRVLTCTSCGHHGFCVETWGGKEND